MATSIKKEKLDPKNPNFELAGLLLGLFEHFYDSLFLLKGPTVLAV
jgi:hypothetical protein